MVQHGVIDLVSVLMGGGYEGKKASGIMSTGHGIIDRFFIKYVDRIPVSAQKQTKFNKSNAINFPGRICADMVFAKTADVK